MKGIVDVALHVTSLKKKETSVQMIELDEIKNSILQKYNQLSAVI